MSHLRLEFTYPSPSDAVWRALTESHILALWLAENDLIARPGHHFRMRAYDLTGLGVLINGEIVEVRPGDRLTMLWEAEDLRLRVTWLLRPVPGGTVVEVVHSGFHGVRGTSRRTALRHTYAHVFDVRLRDVLAAELAPRPPVRPTPLPPEPSARPTPEVNQPRRFRPSRWQAVVPIVFAGIVGSLAAWLTGSAPAPPTTANPREPASVAQAGPDHTPTMPASNPALGQAAAQPTTASMIGRQTSGATMGPTTPAATPTDGPSNPADLTATYEIRADDLSYVVTIVNPGDVPATDWTVELRIPSHDVVSATGATFTQQGSTATFHPTDATSTVPPHASVQFTAVLSRTPDDPKTCTINDHPCG